MGLPCSLMVVNLPSLFGRGLEAEQTGGRRQGKGLHFHLLSDHPAEDDAGEGAHSKECLCVRTLETTEEQERRGGREAGLFWSTSLWPLQKCCWTSFQAPPEVPHLPTLWRATSVKGSDFLREFAQCWMQWEKCRRAALLGRHCFLGRE